MYRKNLDLAYLAAATTPGTSNPLVTATEQPWEHVSNVVQVKSGFGASGAKIGTSSEEITGTAAYSAYQTTKLLMHMEDVGLTDEAGHTVNKVGNVARTADPAFGTYSAIFDGTGDYLTVADSDDWSFGTGGFVIDFRLKFTALARSCFIHQSSSLNTNEWLFFYDSNKVYFYIFNGGVTDLYFNANWTPSTGQFYHVALIRSSTASTDWTVTIDGTPLSKTLAAGSYAASMPNLAASLAIGARIGDTFDLNGKIDEFRISKGTDRGWVSGFTPPVAAYGADGIISSDMVSSGTKSFAPASLKVTINGTERTAPADLATMDSTFDGVTGGIDYSFDASGSDGTTGYGGTLLSATAFTALSASTFSAKSHLFLKFIPVSGETITAPKLTTQSTATILAQTAGLTLSVNSVAVVDLQADGDIVGADISADDIILTGSVDQDREAATVKSQTKSDNYTMTDADSGYVTYVDTDAKTITLPATAVNRTFTLMNAGADGAVALTISPNASDKIIGAGFTAADNKDIVNTKATAKKGDYVTLIGDGVDGWLVTAMKGTWARES